MLGKVVLCFAAYLNGVGSYNNDHVDATPTPSFGGASASHAPGEVRIAPGARPFRTRGRRPVRIPPEQQARALEADRRRIKTALTITIGILTLIWGVYFVNAQFDLGWKQFGNRPLQIRGLAGILTMPFLHGDFQHLWGNTVSFFSLNAMLVYFYRDLGLRVLAWSWIGTGLLLWLSGAQGNHIGLSGVVYAQVAFLFFSGILRRDPRLIRVALVVVFLYGSIVWGVFPIEEGVSWEGHLSGASMGTFLALVWRKQGPQRPPLPAMEDEDEAWTGTHPASAEGDYEERATRGGAILQSAPGILGEAAVEDTWLTSDIPATEADDWGARRAALMWRGERPLAAENAKSRRGGIRKPRKGGHIKSRTRR